MRAIVMSEVAMPADKKPLITLVMDRDQIRQIDDFRFEHRFPSRAAAMKWLMGTALAAGLKPTPADHDRWS